jgi:ankyrin repeat protein
MTFSHWDVAAVLLNHGADPNATDGSDSTPLTMVAGAGNAATVTRLLEHGARVNTPDKNQDTPLIEAASYGRTDVINVLLDNGANPNIKGRNGRTALAVAKDIGTADLLLSHGANADDLITWVFGKDAKLNARQQLLLKATITGNVQTMNAAAPSRVEVNQVFAEGSTFLHLSAMFGRVRMVDWLLEHGADANKANADGMTPLHAVAVTPGAPQKTQVMEMLVKHGANIDATNKNGTTPLHIAAATSNKEVLDLLLRKGADPVRRDKEGRTPTQLAQRSQFGTGLFGSQTSGDATQKVAIIEALRMAANKRSLPQ